MRARWILLGILPLLAAGSCSKGHPKGPAAHPRSALRREFTFSHLVLDETVYFMGVHGFIPPGTRYLLKGFSNIYERTATLSHECLLLDAKEDKVIGSLKVDAYYAEKGPDPVGLHLSLNCNPDLLPLLTSWPGRDQVRSSLKNPSVSSIHIPDCTVSLGDLSNGVRTVSLELPYPLPRFCKNERRDFGYAEVFLTRDVEQLKQGMRLSVLDKVEMYEVHQPLPQYSVAEGSGQARGFFLQGDRIVGDWQASGGMAGIVGKPLKPRMHIQFSVRRGATHVIKPELRNNLSAKPKWLWPDQLPIDFFVSGPSKDGDEVEGGLSYTNEFAWPDVVDENR